MTAFEIPLEYCLIHALLIRGAMETISSSTSSYSSCSFNEPAGRVHQTWGQDPDRQKKRAFRKSEFDAPAPPWPSHHMIDKRADSGGDDDDDQSSQVKSKTEQSYCDP